MTIEQMRSANYGGTVEPTSLDLPEFGAKFAPESKNVFNEGIPRPLTDADYNGIPVAQMEEFAKGAHMDGLHRLDNLANDHAKGKALNAVLDVDVQNFGKEKGYKNFINRFKKSS